MSKRSVIANEGRAVASGQFDVSTGAEPAKRVQLLPMGTFSCRDGRGPFTVRDQAHAQQIVAATQALAGKQDMAIDYDHQTIFGVKPDVAKKAIASGWIKPGSLTAEADGIWGEPDWTAAAADHIRAKEYRYLSPVFGHDKASGAVTRIFNVALTNIPALDDLAAIAAALQQEDSMDLTKFAKAAGLSETASEDQVLAAIAANRTAAGELLSTASALGLGAGATGEAIVAAARATATPDPAKFVPIAIVTDLQTQVSALVSGQAEQVATAAVDAAVGAGKVTPGQRDWALGYAKSDPTGFEAYVAAAAVIVPPGERKTPKTPPDATSELSAEDKAVCASMGWDETKFLETRKQEMAR